MASASWLALYGLSSGGTWMNKARPELLWRALGERRGGAQLTNERLFIFKPVVHKVTQVSSGIFRKLELEAGLLTVLAHL